MEVDIQVLAVPYSVCPHGTEILLILDSLEFSLRIVQALRLCVLK